LEYPRGQYHEEVEQHLELSAKKPKVAYCPKQLKDVAYFAMVRSILEHSSAVWDPHLQKDIDNVSQFIY